MKAVIANQGDINIFASCKYFSDITVMIIFSDLFLYRNPHNGLLKLIFKINPAFICKHCWEVVV